MGAFKIGQKFTINDENVEIVDIIKGDITNKPNMQSGEVFTGYKYSSCRYLLSNGRQVLGSTLAKYRNIN